MSDLMLDVGQANELKLAFRRAGATPEEVKRMGEGDFMKGVIGLLRGEYTLTPVAKAVVTAIEQLNGTVDVDGSLTPEQALKTCNRKEFVHKDVLSTMPRGKAGAVEIVFVKFGRYIKADSLVEELRQQGLALADPFTLMAWNAVNREFADTHPNTTEWLDDAGKYCYATFDRWNGKRRVDVGRDVDGWSGGWWFAGVRISTVD